ncbi:FcoT family thioesterase [Streptomyces sp. NPDC055051]
MHPGGADGRPLTGSGMFTIPEPCYIDDTGHFNAVEFNICYNQLAYYTLAAMIRDRVHGCPTSSSSTCTAAFSA